MFPAIVVAVQDGQHGVVFRHLISQELAPVFVGFPVGKIIKTR